MRLVLAVAAGFAVATLAGPAFTSAAEDIMTKAKCSGCNTATTTKKGPSFASIAAKYAGKPDPTPAIVDMLKTGSKDDHNKVVASDADLKAIAAIVLTSK